jgi:hypothetical protein
MSFSLDVMLPVDGNFQVLRRRVKAIRVLAALSAVAGTPVFTLLALLLWLVPFVGGFGISVSEIFCGLRRFFFRLYSGHVLRPFTLRSVSGARF